MNAIKSIIITFIIMQSTIHSDAQSIRNQKDTVGFASKAYQMDSVMSRLKKRYGKYYDSLYKAQNVNKEDILRFAICPHDDYLYAGYLYNELYPHIKAKTVIILGVAHKAKKFKVEQKLVFDSYSYWHAAYSNIKISALREQIMKNLPKDDYIVHDSLQTEEHSVEAFVPFLQYYNKDVQIVSILVPHMPFGEMKTISADLAKSIQKVLTDNKLQWGKDVALLVSTDAVHYGDEDWGGSNYARFGCDTAGYKKAVELEHQIMKDCLVTPDSASAKKFVDYTVKSDDWREYKWTWCGRYSVPFGLLTAYQLQQLRGEAPLKLIISDYSTSIARKPLKVEDLNMGATAPAKLHHWVGYAVAGFK
jgi:AmmeMemoRadiSam system protein B